MKKLLSILLTVLLASCESCGIDPNPKTELEKLPAATQEGKNTFGCLVNGKAWVPSSSIGSSAFYQLSQLQISASVEDADRDQSLSLLLFDNLLTIKTYPLIASPDSTAEFIDIKSKSNICIYEYKDLIDGGLTITKFNSITHIISGQFEFTTFVSGCDTIKVTNGRFDLTYAN